MIARRPGVAVLLLAALAILPATICLWPHLPPLFEDEVLPLVPLVPLLKEPAAYGGAFLSNQHVDVLGYPVCLVSYVIEGPLKALAYALVMPVTRAAYRPESLIVAYRLSNVVWTWLLAATLLGTCRALGGWRAALLCLGLLVPDHALVYLGLTDLGRPIHLIFALILLRLVCRHVDAPRRLDVLVVGLVAFLGIWNRVDFLWFVAASLVGALVVDVCLRRTTSVALAGAYALALGLTYLVVPRYLEAVSGGHRIALAEVGTLWHHLRALAVMMDPFGTYRRHLEVGPHLMDAAYVGYRYAYVTACLVVSAGLAGLGLRTGRGAYVVAGLFPSLLLAAVVDTTETYEVHHVAVIKPALYVAASVLAAELVAWRRLPALLAWSTVAAAALWVQLRAFADVTTAAPATGIYGVTWNMSEAWQAATRSAAPVVVGADFGVWVPGLLASRPDQRWESTGFPDEPSLDVQMQGQGLVGFVVRADGPNAWITQTERYRVVERRRFDTHPGDAWVFLLLAPS